MRWSIGIHVVAVALITLWALTDIGVIKSPPIYATVNMLAFPALAVLFLCPIATLWLACQTRHRSAAPIGIIAEACLVLCQLFAMLPLVS